MAIFFTDLSFTWLVVLSFFFPFPWRQIFLSDVVVGRFLNLLRKEFHDKQVVFHISTGGWVEVAISCGPSDALLCGFSLKILMQSRKRLRNNQRDVRQRYFVLYNCKLAFYCLVNTAGCRHLLLVPGNFPSRRGSSGSGMRGRFDCASQATHHLA